MKSVRKTSIATTACTSLCACTVSTVCDLYAREAMQNFCTDGTGWDDEQLVATDISPITWRKVASRWNQRDR